MKGSDIAVRIEKLELNKIKVTVYPVDLNDMNINIKALKPDSPQLHSFLFKIMEKVKRETGFNPYSGQIMVEALPVGDCMELIVTKICEKKNNIQKPALKKVHATLKNKKLSNIIYLFSDFENMCKALIILSDNTLINSSCYKIEDNHVIAASGISLNEHILLKEFVNDYDNTKLSARFLEEHGELIAEKEHLLSMANGIAELYNTPRNI